MDWATGVDGATGVTEMDRATGSIYSGDPGVDGISSYIIFTHTMNYTVDLFQLLLSLSLSKIS
jgi:hypothetical protein